MKFAIRPLFAQRSENANHLFLQWSGGQVVEIPVETSEDILGNVYGDFKVVQQLDQEGNDCRISYSSCIEINRQCGGSFVVLRPQGGANLAGSMAPDRYTVHTFSEKDVNLYPNPARQVVYLGLEDYAGETLDVKLYDAVSRQIKRISVVHAADTPLEMNLAEIPNGVYHISITPEDVRPILRKLVVARN
ncbi:MAG: T9SS type A sorting domain-containing protein [Lewinellaceae bacterium]|nr:T9SS type A sorting domain-containing protein [Lewinellaceae bacterium]